MESEHHAVFFTRISKKDLSEIDCPDSSPCLQCCFLKKNNVVVDDTDLRRGLVIRCSEFDISSLGKAYGGSVLATTYDIIATTAKQ